MSPTNAGIDAVVDNDHASVTPGQPLLQLSHNNNNEFFKLPPTGPLWLSNEDNKVIVPPLSASRNNNVCDMLNNPLDINHVMVDCFCDFHDNDVNCVSHLGMSAAAAQPTTTSILRAIDVHHQVILDDAGNGNIMLIHQLS